MRIEYKRLEGEARSGSSQASLMVSFQWKLETLRTECEKIEDRFVDGRKRPLSAVLTSEAGTGVIR
jgi:hypothetical protein